MISTTNRVFDYFTTIGIDDKLIENKHADEIEYPLIGLDIIHQELTAVKDTATEKYVDILGNKSLWLRCYHGKDKPAITEIGLYYFKSQNANNLVIKEKNNMIPVPIVSDIEERNPVVQKVTIDGSDHWTGRFDLTQLIFADEKPGFSFAISYKCQSKKNYNTQILKVRVITAKSSNNNKLKNGDLHVVIPIQHEIINFSFGIEIKNRVFAYMKDTEIQQKRFKPAVLDRYPLKDHSHTPFPDAVSQFCFPEGVQFKRDNLTQPESFSFVLTLQDGCRIYCTCLIFNEIPDKRVIDQLGHIKIDETNPLYVQKAICLISHYNYFDEYKQILKHLYRLSLSKNEIPIERFICNIVDDISDWGKVGIQYEIGAETVVFGTSHKYPPFSSKSLLTLFRLLDIDKIIFLFECVLLEKKIFIISKYKSVITQVSEALISLIFPFQWNHVYIPILPDMFKTYMEAPLPFIIGLEQKIKNFEVSSGIQSESIQAYLDSNDLINIEWMPALPEKFLKQLKKRLMPYASLHLPIYNVKNYLEQQDQAFENPLQEEEAPIDNFDPYDIRDSFMEFVSSFMMKYKKFLIPPDKKKSNKEMSEIIDTREFLNFHKSSKQGTFLQKFVETTMFSYFIEQRTQISPYEPYYQFFDICLEKKRTKKDHLLFIKDQLTKIIYVQQPNEQNLDKNRKKLLNEQKFIIKFPKLKLELYNKCELVEEVFKAEFNLMEIEQNHEDISNLDEYRWAKYLYEQIYFIWFQVLIQKVKQDFFSLYYTKLIDYAIFILGQLRKKNHQLTEIMYRFVIEACGYYGKDDRVIELVQQMKEQNIETSPITHGVFFQAVTTSKEYFASQEEMRKKIFENQVTIIEEDEKDNSENQEQKIARGLNNLKLNTGTQIQQASFISKFDNVFFTIIDTCPTCNRNLFPEEIISNWKKLNNDYRTKCPIPNCQHEFVAKFQVITLEENKLLDLTNSTVYNNMRKQIEFLSPIIVRKELENIMKQKGQSTIMSAKFEEDHPIIYWNIILYFKLIRAPTFFLEFGQPEQFYNYHALQYEKKIQESIKNQEKGILLKMSEYFFQNKNQDDDKTSNSSFTHLSPPQDNGSMGSMGARKDQKDAAIINFGTKSIKKIFTKLFIKLRKDGENKIHDLEMKKIALNTQKDEQKNLEKNDLPQEDQINPIPPSK